jgi:hypothetical protein
MNAKNFNINKFKLNDNVEFLEKATRNWRYGRIIEIKNMNRYKIYSGIDIFWAKEVREGHKTQLETL